MEVPHVLVAERIQEADPTPVARRIADGTELGSWGGGGFWVCGGFQLLWVGGDPPKTRGSWFLGGIPTSSFSLG